MYIERMKSVLLTLWASNSGSGGASTSNGGSGGTMVVSGKDVDRRMGMGNISQPRILGSRVSSPRIGSRGGGAATCIVEGPTLGSWVRGEGTGVV